MLARIRKAQEEREGGFTLIELLVVMIIIGILAAIAIPIFLNQRKKAQDSAAKADVSTLGKEIATYYVDNSGAVPAVAGSGTRWTVATVDVGKQSNNVVLINSKGTSDSNWCVAVKNDQGSQKYFQYSAQGGLENSTATGCP
jgi:prepilin-type N-terminal cleavage/methylation domain-containing protein